MNREDQHTLLSTVVHIDKIRKKKLVTRTDLTSLRIQENIRRYNQPIAAADLSDLSITTETKTNFHNYFNNKMEQF